MIAHDRQRILSTIPFGNILFEAIRPPFYSCNLFRTTYDFIVKYCRKKRWGLTTMDNGNEVNIGR
jgi:hypothetical protein